MVCVKTTSPLTARFGGPLARRLGIVLLCGLLFSGCASYQVGNHTLFPADVSTVYVPMVESASFRPGLGETLTEAICKEIENRTNYKVVGNPNADSILKVELIEDSKRIAVENLYDEQRLTDVNYQVKVTWINRKGDPIYENAVPLPPEFVELGQSAAYIPEYGQTYITTKNQIAQRMARQIVGLMENPW
jgi:hypothetical protein